MRQCRKTDTTRGYPLEMDLHQVEMHHNIPYSNFVCSFSLCFRMCCLYECIARWRQQVKHLPCHDTRSQDQLQSEYSRSEYRDINLIIWLSDGSQKVSKVRGKLNLKHFEIQFSLKFTWKSLVFWKTFKFCLKLFKDWTDLSCLQKIVWGEGYGLFDWQIKNLRNFFSNGFSN